MLRIGQSRDIHRLEENHRPLILSGVPVPYEKGPVSHSDGDVVFHAVAEALLGTLALGDLGTFFPDSDPRYKDMNSECILRECYHKVRAGGYALINLDVSVICERPKLKPYLPEMRRRMAAVLEVSEDRVSIKAQTNESCGEIGKGEAIEATCVVLIGKEGL